jgi:hypothetical protein
MSDPGAPEKPATVEPQPASAAPEETGRPVCQLCGGQLIEIRAKLQCERCHTIWETCCEGGRG